LINSNKKKTIGKFKRKTRKTQKKKLVHQALQRNWRKEATGVHTRHQVAIEDEVINETQ